MARVIAPEATDERRQADAEAYAGIYRCARCGAIVELDADDVRPVIAARLAIPDGDGRGMRVQFVPAAPCCGRVATLWRVSE